MDVIEGDKSSIELLGIGGGENEMIGESELEYAGGENESGDAVIDSTLDAVGSGDEKRPFNLIRSLSCKEDKCIIILLAIYCTSHLTL